jgi:cyclophilin family peptidyl-prolyl cis-trans isomerase
MATCVPLRDAGVVSPDDVSGLTVTASTLTPEVFEGTAVTLAADAGGGTPPYLFRWDQNGGPAELTLTEVTNSTFTTGTLLEIGTYTFRAVVTDSTGNHATDYVAVQVQSVVTATAPKLAVVGVPVLLSATLETQSGAATVLWEVTFGDALLSDTSSANPTLTSNGPGTIRLRLTTTIPSTPGAPMTIKRDFEIASVVDLTPQILIETNFGNITIELDGEAAPLHMANFLLYMDDGFYAGTLFHRSACTSDAVTGGCEPFVLQGGGYKRVNGALEAVAVTRDPVPSEADNGLSNGVLYSVALALNGGNPDSGTTQFFINLSEKNSFLDAQGFTVFGKVVEGTNVVDDIAAMATIASPIVSGEVSLPAQDVIMERVTRVSIVE